MSIDMSQFYQVFFEEAQEHLDSMESLLLGLDIGAPDAEQLNAIFRAAHSIKGSAGTFGFTDLAEVTHILESLLDRIRKGGLAIRADMIDAFLAAGDVLKALLAAHRDGGAADPAQVAAICQRLSALTAGAPSSVSAAAPEPAVAAAAAQIPVPAAVTVAPEELEASFVLDMDADAAVGAIDNLLAELDRHWPATMIKRASADDPRWRLRIAAGAEPEIVRGMLEFVARSDSIRIGATDAKASDADDSDGAYGLFDAVPPAPTLAAAGSEAAAPPALTRPERRSAPRPAAAAESSIRVDVDKVDQLVNLIGELVITQSMLAQSASTLDPVKFERLHAGLAQLERNTRDMQEAVMSVRMMPISAVFSRFPRVVRDLAQKLGKQIELRTTGEDTELDKGLIERISDPLTHLIRNSIDHGVEIPADRIALGKPPTGTIALKAYHQGGSIVIEVGDDGGGLNRHKILAKARERGLPVHDQMSDGEVWLLIFEPGFSTAEKVTEVSGRGVGMDVVKRNIAAMGGRVEIESMTGIGTRMTVRLPLTLAILDGMSVAVGKETYIVPLGHILESLQVETGMIKSVSGVERLIHVRGEYLPVVALYELFRISGSKKRLDEGIMVVLEADGAKAALFVDALLGQHPVVIKSLESNYRKVPGISAATIMGDGHVALILDVAALVQMAKSALPEAA
ncbi:MAG: two-component system chemotaxis family sensor kinase CheA [Rhodocyclaceae bacterium]|nr:MAG: two-component system chemotaxis family sensor kinase CheA [Rhodocyclaceae bacterium]TND02821.1 MAG: two-component system, chemotaxis family, sensor kinase CheA [Rhodocyclaceae bacterium]